MKLSEKELLQAFSGVEHQVEQLMHTVTEQKAYINSLESLLLKVQHQASRKLYIKTELLNEIKIILRK